MSDNFSMWRHINTAPKDREILVWDGEHRHVGYFEDDGWVTETGVIWPTHWRGCPPPPVQDDNEE